MLCKDGECASHWLYIQRYQTHRLCHLYTWGLGRGTEDVFSASPVSYHPAGRLWSAFSSSVRGQTIKRNTRKIKCMFDIVAYQFSFKKQFGWNFSWLLQKHWNHSGTSTLYYYWEWRKWKFKGWLESSGLQGWKRREAARFSWKWLDSCVLDETHWHVCEF